MTTAEIQALVAEAVQWKSRDINAVSVACLINAINSLLARDNIRTFAEQEVRIVELEAKLNWAQQLIKAQEQTSNGMACAEERDRGNGGCGACSWCCTVANNRVADLTAELARVKADSLRVVPVGEPVAVSELHSRQAFTCDHDGVWMIFGCSSWDFSIRNLIDYSETELTENTVVQPVRLERWEATNDHH